MDNNYLTLYSELKRLVVYRSILEDPVLKRLMLLLEDLRSDKAGPDTETQSLAYDFLKCLVTQCERRGLTGNAPRKYFLHMLLMDENEFSVGCESRIPPKNTTVYQLAVRDMKVIIRLLRFDFSGLFQILNTSCEEIIKYVPKEPLRNRFIDTVPDNIDAAELTDRLAQQYLTWGAGLVAENKILGFNGAVLTEGVSESKTPKLIGLGEQRSIIRRNTEAFISGAPANDIMLVGCEGMGKKSALKELADTFYDGGLRIIEINKDVTVETVEILYGLLAKRGKSFILMLNNCHAYAPFFNTITPRPKNLLLYAVSNNAEDSSYFGIKLEFPKPDIEEYLRIIKELSKEMSAPIPDSLLKEHALEWIKDRSDITRASAKHFIGYFMWEIIG